MLEVRATKKMMDERPHSMRRVSHSSSWVQPGNDKKGGRGDILNTTVGTAEKWEKRAQDGYTEGWQCGSATATGSKVVVQQGFNTERVGHPRTFHHCKDQPGREGVYAQLMGANEVLIPACTADKARAKTSTSFR